MANGIYKKLHAIMREADYIQKDKKNEHFKYTYASEAAIKEKIHELLVKYGVLFNASGINHQVCEYKKNDRGQAQYRTTLDITYRFIDVDDGSFIEGTMPGAGVDGEDKGTYKAITGAIKYILTSAFLIPTGDDPEKDADGRSATMEETIVLTRTPVPQRSSESVVAAGVPVKPPEPAIEMAEPVSDDDPYITKQQRAYLSKRFRESLNPDLATKADEFRHAALTAMEQSGLFRSKFTDDFGNPSHDRILKAEYEVVGKSLVKAAKSL